MAERKQVNKIEVLYLSYDGLTDPLGQSQILPYLCGIAGSGYSITIVSFEKRERFKINREHVLSICRAYQIDWIALRYHKFPAILSTIFDLVRMRMTARKLHKEKQFAIVHCRSYLTALIGIWMKQRHQVKFIFDMRGFWVDERVEGGLWNLKNPLYATVYKYFKRKEKAFLRDADSIIVLTDAANREVLSWNLNTNITIIPCCVDLKRFDPRRFSLNDRNGLRLELGVRGDDYLLLYLGSLGTWYLYQDMISFFDQVKKQRPNAKFLFITQDIERVETNPDFIAVTVSRDEIPKYIFACDASVCFIKPSFSKKGSSATKLAEVLAMGLPIITNPGWGDVEYLSQHIRNILLFSTNELIGNDFLSLTTKDQDNFFSTFFSLEMGVEKYCRVYGTLSKTTNAV